MSFYEAAAAAAAKPSHATALLEMVGNNGVGIFTLFLSICAQLYSFTAGQLYCFTTEPLYCRVSYKNLGV